MNYIPFPSYKKIQIKIVVNILIQPYNKRCIAAQHIGYANNNKKLMGLNKTYEGLGTFQNGFMIDL